MSKQVNTQSLIYQFLIAVVAILIGIGLPACDDCILGEKNQHLDMGDIPAAVRECVPYQDGDSVIFADSKGNIYLFKVKREFKDHETYRQYDCRANHYKYQTDSIQFNSDSYKRELSIKTSNFQSAGLNIINNYSIHFGKRYFNVPISEKAKNLVDQVDTFIVDAKIYTDVFVITPTTFGYSWMDSVNPDTIFYNYKYGILKIALSDSTYLFRKD